MGINEHKFVIKSCSEADLNITFGHKLSGFYCVFWEGGFRWRAVWRRRWRRGLGPRRRLLALCSRLRWNTFIRFQNLRNLNIDWCLFPSATRALKLFFKKEQKVKFIKLFLGTKYCKHNQSHFLYLLNWSLNPLK